METTGLSLEDRRQFKNLVIGKLQVDTAEEPPSPMIGMRFCMKTVSCLRPEAS